MPLVTCPKCDQETIVPGAMMGLETTCLMCGTTYTVGDDPEPAPSRRGNRRRPKSDSMDTLGIFSIVLSCLLLGGMVLFGIAKTVADSQRDAYDRQVERWSRDNPAVDDFNSKHTKAVQLYRALQGLVILASVFHAAGGVLVIVGKGYRSAVMRVAVAAAVMAIPINFLLMFML